MECRHGFVFAVAVSVTVGIAVLFSSLRSTTSAGAAKSIEVTLLDRRYASESALRGQAPYILGDHTGGAAPRPAAAPLLAAGQGAVHEQPAPPLQPAKARPGGGGSEARAAGKALYPVSPVLSSSTKVDAATAAKDAVFVFYKCVAGSRNVPHIVGQPAAAPGLDAAACAKVCAGQGFQGFGISVVAQQCWCTDHLVAFDNAYEKASACDACSAGDKECELSRSQRSMTYAITSALPEIITIYVAPAKRTSSMFMSGRLNKYFSGRFAIRYKPLNAQLSKTDERWRREMCVDNPGKKIFVQIVGAVVYLLKHWPANSVLIMTADEVGNWGLGKGDRRFGPHGKGKEFGTNESHPYKHIILPKAVFPMFRQYYHYRQIEAFGADSMRFVPLGSRGEFPDSPPDQLVPAPKRTYVYSYMAAITDGTRAKVHTLLANDTVIKPASRFIHVSQSWHGSANNEEYVSPERYHEVMQQSAFSICPKGTPRCASCRGRTATRKDASFSRLLAAWATCCLERQPFSGVMPRRSFSPA